MDGNPEVLANGKVAVSEADIGKTIGRFDAVVELGDVAVAGVTE